MTKINGTYIEIKERWGVIGLKMQDTESINTVRRQVLIKITDILAGKGLISEEEKNSIKILISSKKDGWGE